MQDQAKPCLNAEVLLVFVPKVERQTQDPYFGRGGGFGDLRRGDGGLGGGGSEWTPPGRRYGREDLEDDFMSNRRPGWSPPGREEWRPSPSRRDDGDDDADRKDGDGRGGRGPSRRGGWGDDGGFRGKPL